MDEIKKEMERVAEIEQENAEKYTQECNDAPCDVCGSNEFVQKFRNVVGEITGSMHGYFSLFGGSITGSINGYTKTLPVLSCRKCENEREIKTWNYVHAKDKFWRFMHQFYFKIDGGFKNENLYTIDQFFLERPVETREYMLANRNYDYDFYNEIPRWSTEIWAKAGFKIDKIKIRFLFWSWEVYPTWKELINSRSNINIK